MKETAHISWQTIDEVASDLSVKPAARRKWKQRNRVPYQWRIAIAEALARAGRPVSLRAFDKPFHEQSPGIAA